MTPGTKYLLLDTILEYAASVAKIQNYELENNWRAIQKEKEAKQTLWIQINNLIDEDKDWELDKHAYFYRYEIKGKK